MKRNVFIAMTILSSATVFAAEDNAGKIHFTGEIIEPSCVIIGDGGTNEYKIPLGTYPTSFFSSIGTESDLVPVGIILEDCPLRSDGLPNIQLTFTGPFALTNSNTLLDVSKITTNGATAATGVGIALSPSSLDTTFIKVDGSEGQLVLGLPAMPTDRVNATFNARYKSFASTVTAGPADADLTINIVYH
ncbi:fimbrial protein [Hafnia sp.]|uniref:fimbrial protein n=1 Tax=Hafnia sp. TaxID=1873498 RepID=UPI002FC72C55